MLNPRNKPKMFGVANDIKKTKTATTVSKIHHDITDNKTGTSISTKRQGDSLADPTQKRRPAFGDITNALQDKQNIKDALKKSKIVTKKPTVIIRQDKPSNKKKKVPTASKPAQQENRENLDLTDDNVITLSQSSHISSSQDSLVSSSQESNSSSSTQSSDTDFQNQKNEELSQEAVLLLDVDTSPMVVEQQPIDDVDKENMTDVVQVAFYAQDIFNYYKEREVQFMVESYMCKQKTLTNNMRAILVDWLVEVQENFELNHETLYLAVKLMDTYLSIKEITKERLQLVGAASMFIACKFDERCPPLVEDFLYICDDAYIKREFLAMERSILKTIGFDIGMPLSYRFLRRYAKCARANMDTLTLARYILEMSLMDYDCCIKYKESMVASATLWLALKMKSCGDWTSTLEYYTGYTEKDFIHIARHLNTYIAAPPKQLNTIRSKYSHKVFYEVAKVPALSDSVFH